MMLRRLHVICLLFLGLSIFKDANSFDPSDTTTVILGQEFRINPIALKDTCKFHIANPDVASFNVLVPNATLRNYPGNPTERLRNYWQYKLEGSGVTDCGIYVTHAVLNDHGVWQIEIDQDQEKEKIQHFVEVLVPPESVDIPVSELVIKLTGNVTSKTESVTCKAIRSRPAPEIQWLLDDQDVTIEDDRTETNFSSSTDDKNSHMITVVDTLTHNFTAEDDGKTLRCIYSHPAKNETSEVYEDFVTINVEAPPVHSSLKTEPSGTYALNEPADIIVQFHSNPAPLIGQWKMHDLTIPFNVTLNKTTTRDSQQSGRYTFYDMTGDDRQFSARLVISELTQDDLSKTNYLTVRNLAGSTQFEIVFPQPESGVLTGGAIAGIVIGVLIVVAIIGGLTFYAMKKKRKNKAKRSRNLTSPPPQVLS